MIDSTKENMTIATAVLAERRQEDRHDWLLQHTALGLVLPRGGDGVVHECVDTLDAQKGVEPQPKNSILRRVLKFLRHILCQTHRLPNRHTTDVDNLGSEITISE